MLSFSRSLVIILAALSISSAVLIAEPVEKSSDGVVFPVGGGFLKLQVYADNVVRVAYAKDRGFFSRASLVVLPRSGRLPSWQFTSTPKSAVLSTAKLKVHVGLSTGAVSFTDASGQPITAEAGRVIAPAEVQGEQTFHVQQTWKANLNESLYGLGENQLGLLNIKGYDLDLWQHNGTDAVPFLVSSRGYGILWDNPSFTRFGDLRPFEAIPAARLLDANGKPGGLTGTYFSGAHFEKLVATRIDDKIDYYITDGTAAPNKIIHPDLPDGDVSVRWEGQLDTEVGGDYLFQTFYNSGAKLWIGDKLVIDHWRQFWLPWKDIAKVHLEAKRRYPIRLEWTKDPNVLTAITLQWKTPSSSTDTSLWSEVGEGVDYYFVYGPDIDKVIGGYRQITGQAPMMPVWAFGLWQSRQRYKTAQESLDVIDSFRSRTIPFDNIVQDWFYWKEAEWGSHRFDPERFPDPDAWIRSIHEKNARLMISVWGKFYPGTENFEAMRSKGFLYETNLKEGIRDWINHPFTFYDAFNPEARKLFWSQVNSNLFSKGVDAWWMDATEPDLTATPTLEGQRIHVHPTGLGSGSRVLNAYPLLNSEGVYNGQRSAKPDQRVFILTRSAFAGQQRYAAATWSGDITSTWTAMRQQIPAGLGFCISGIPYWTMDVGGFSVPARFSAENPKPEDVAEWRELNARWFQFGTFVPLLRVHGEAPNREMWFFGGESDPAYRTQLMFDRLRYRMLPYVYSLAGAVTHEGSTMMRPLVMDFRNDGMARDISDQYMFGPALLVNPVTTYKARSRTVYLPKGSRWYDFWTGKLLAGGKAIDAPAPYDSMPVYVKAGSIIPFGPEIQYTTEKPTDPITVFVYAGANGGFTLYEDDGLTYGYEKGQSSRIPLRWDDGSKTLTIGARQGSFPGMLSERTFQVVTVGELKPTGFSFTPPIAQTVKYQGKEVTVKLP